ncbi:hypothetical protein QLG07_05015 [Erwinia sp. V90_4]|uniref:hypothetical protein n=1 Tax=Erwinia TaxID=551 RepID=UPI00249E3B20|nr:hypothetical protein [Erwinia sp. V90_4]MDI3438810.1 hypothetical protein [Erwinia sp. V90_4]
MAIPEWIIITFLVFLVVAILVFLIYLSIDIVNTLSKRTLKKKLEIGLCHDDLSFSDFKNLQSNLNLSDRHVHSALLNLKSNLDFGADEKRAVIKPRLDGLIKEFNTNKPFSELPIGLVEPLVEAKSKSSEPKIIDDLSEKITIHLKRKKRNDLLISLATYIGLIIGLIGTVSGLMK